MRSALIATLLVACSLHSVRVPAGAQHLRVIEFGDHPDPNTGTPEMMLPGAQPWPSEFGLLTAAVSKAVDRQVSIYDIRHGAASVGATQQTEETTVRILETTADGIRVLVQMESSPTSVEAVVPRNGTVVIGSQSSDERHAFVAVSLTEATSDIFSTREPGVKPPVKVSGAALQPTAAALEHHLIGVVVETQIDENGNVVEAHALLGRYRSTTDASMIENTIRAWRFRPATLDGKPVPVVTRLVVNYARTAKP